jgi:predicted ATPase/DNA-binding CsgD family transcriptional regulator
LNSEAQHSLIEPLTKREQDVLNLLVEGKTNREIAETLVLSMNTVKWYNRQIYGKLGIENRERLADRARELGLVGRGEAAARPTYNLPRPATMLLGRERELVELEELLLDGRTRIVSIIGPGGMGKTRLALEVAHRLNGRFTDGASFVPLAPLQTGDSIIPAIAQSLHFTFQSGSQDEKTQLLNFLREKKLLIILDNFEHLIDGAPLLPEIAEAAPKLKMVVTSREKLKLQIEQLYPLESLPLLNWETAEQAEQDPVVRLFLEYGRRVRPNFELQTVELDSLRQILQLLGRMPLAIILASAWLELLTLSEIAAEIQKNLDFLEADYQDLPGRQHSMRTVFNASWNQLNEAEQKIFSALSVFRGGFTLDAARKVVGAAPGILLGLVSRSLLSRDENGQFQFHELLRQFAAESLTLSPTYEAAVRDNHSGYYLNLLEASESELKGANSENIIELIKTNIDNIYEAWNRAVKEERFLQLAPAAFSLTHFSHRSGRYRQTLAAFSQSASRIKQYLAQTADADPATIAVQIRLLAYQCELHERLGDVNQAAACGHEALSLLERTELKSFDVRYEKALSQCRLGWAYGFLEDRFDEAKALLVESLALFERLEDAWQIAYTNYLLGGIGLRSANFEEADRRHRKAVQLFKELGNRPMFANAQMLVGFGLPLLGEMEEGEALMRSSLAVFRELGEHDFAAMTLTLLSETVIYQGNFQEARALAANAMAEHQRLGQNYWFTGDKNKWGWATLHLGDYEMVLDQAHSIFDYARVNNAKMMIGTAHSQAGDAWLTKLKLDKALEHLKASAAVLREIGSRDYLCFTLGSLCCANIKSGEISEAEKVIPEALEFALSQKTTLYLAAILPSLALLRASRGMEESAVELYALACREPYVANSRWYEDVFGRPIAQAAAALPPEVVEAAKERGRELDLWQTAESLLTELSATH